MSSVLSSNERNASGNGMGDECPDEDVELFLDWLIQIYDNLFFYYKGNPEFPFADLLSPGP